MVRRSFNLERSDLERMQEIADETGVTVNVLVRYAVRRWVRDYDGSMDFIVQGKNDATRALI